MCNFNDQQNPILVLSAVDEDTELFNASNMSYWNAFTASWTKRDIVIAAFAIAKNLID